MIFRIILTVIFGFLWWMAVNFAGPGQTYLVILGSILAACVCCCRGGEPSREFNFKNYIACIRRCLPATLTLIFSLFVIGLLVEALIGGGFAMAVVLKILVASIAAFFIRLICCAYD